jgi:hypothetical protein
LSVSNTERLTSPKTRIGSFKLSGEEALVLLHVQRWQWRDCLPIDAVSPAQPVPLRLRARRRPGSQPVWLRVEPLLSAGRRWILREGIAVMDHRLSTALNASDCRDSPAGRR